MIKSNSPIRLGNGLRITLVLTQIVDIIIHAATNQLELVRVTSNIIILLWIVGITLGWFKNRSFLIDAVFIGLYGALNALFLAREGLTNPAQGGSIRIMLLLLVALTIILSTTLMYLRRGWR